ncbi:MAG: HD domain-containing phosphohydrolase [bacterium]
MPNNFDINILVVDDEDYLRRLVARILQEKGYTCIQACSGKEALDLLLIQDFALMITDIMMPGMTGIELLSLARKLRPDIAVIMLTGLDSQETAIQALEQGAYGYMIKPFQPNELLINVINALRRQDLEKLRNDFENDLQAQVLERTRDIRNREEEITMHLVAASEYRDEETGSHIRRIGLYAAALAKALGWSEEQVDLLRLAAPMHDIGKIGIPDHILLKSGKFTNEEFEIMKKHTKMGAGILAGSNIQLMNMAVEIALNHHERWDGSGYPNGLSKEEIPESARIVAIVDVYDALLTDRVYRKAFSEEEAFPMMIAGSGHHFDPKIFQCMCDIHEEFREIRKNTTSEKM